MGGKKQEMAALPLKSFYRVSPGESGEKGERT